MKEFSAHGGIAIRASTRLEKDCHSYIYIKVRRAFDLKRARLFGTICLCLQDKRTLIVINYPRNGSNPGRELVYSCHIM